MVLLVMFWVLWIIWALGLLIPLSAGYSKAHGVIPMILIGILGLKVFGNPLTH